MRTTQPVRIAGTEPLPAVSGRTTVQVVVPYTDPDLARETLRAAGCYTDGLAATIVLLAVVVVPYPAPFYCPEAMRQHLECRLAELAGECTGSIEARIVLARGVDEGYGHAIGAGSTVVVGTRKRWWRTREERLARTLSRMGHSVAVVRVG